MSKKKKGWKIPPIKTREIYSEELVNLVYSMLDEDEHQRPTAKQLLDNKLFDELRNDGWKEGVEKAREEIKSLIEKRNKEKKEYNNEGNEEL